MSIPNAHALAPMVRKLEQHSKLASVEIDAVLAMPYRLATGDPNAYLIRDGDRAGSCIALLSGFVCRSKIAGSGARQIFSVHMRGDLIGLQSGLLVEADHNVQALTSIDVARIPHEAILELIEAHPAVALALWRDTLVDASVLREWMLNVGRRNALQRVSHLFCELGMRQTAAGLCEGPRYALPMTQEQIGDATGLTAVHINRTLQGMRADGLITTSGRSMTIIDWPKLKAAGDFSSGYLHHPVPAGPPAPLAA